MPSQLEALLQQARSALADSNSSLLNNRYPVYPGQTRPEMSALTARKRQIEDNYRLKRPSYTRAIQHATHRATGFKDGDVQSLLDRIQSQQQNLGGYGTQRIKNIFGNTYSGNLQDKINKDTLAKNAQSRVGFDNLANEARNIDTRDNTKTLQTLNALSLSKNATKEGVLGLLEQLGNQKHAYDQAKFNADRAMFNRQANYPYSRTQGLGDAISGGITIADAVRRDRMNAEQGGEFNPLPPTAAEERYAENRLRRGMNNLNTAYPVYPGKLIADLTPDMKLSYNLAERLEPNIQDNSYDERRNLRKRLTDGDITSQKALASLDEKASPLEKNLDKDVQRAIKQVTAKINASRVMSGTFGSKSHQSELDAAIRDIVSGKYGNRANITTDTLSRSLQDLSRENDVTNERVRELDRTGTREITDALNQIRNINQRGATEWGNEQNRLNQQFQQFSDEADWENNNRGNLGSNPQNRGLAIAGGIERASSQSPLVLPQALQFNNLQANIPFEESKVGAATTDPRIQRTSQLFNDEEEMRRIAEAARERQNREELARQREKYGNLPRELIDFIIDLKNKRKQKLLQNGATMREVPAMSHHFVSVRDKTRPRPDLGFIQSDDRFYFARDFHDYQLQTKLRKLFDEMLSKPNERLDFLERFYPKPEDYNGKSYDYNRDFSNFRAYINRPNDSSLWGNPDVNRERENINKIFYNFINKSGAHKGADGQVGLGKKLNADFFGDPEIFDLFTNWSGFYGVHGRRPLNRTKQKLLTGSEYNWYMQDYDYNKRQYEENVRDVRLRPSLAMQRKTASMNAQMEREAIEAAERERWARIAQQQAEARRIREAAEQQAEAARRAQQQQQQQQQQSEGARRMQVYRDLIANIPATSIYPFDAINYAMTGQTSLPSNLSITQRANLIGGALHPNNISHFNYLSQHNPSFNLAQELEYLRNLAQSRLDSAARAQAQMLNDAVRNYRR